MKIRAVKKVLNTSGLKGKINEEWEATLPLPGEWFVTLLSAGLPGKTVLHFLHNPTKLSVFVPGKSLNKAMPDFKNRLEQLLERYRLKELIPYFHIDKDVQIAPTNSRRYVGYLNNMRYSPEHHFREYGRVDEEVLERVEYRMLYYLVGSEKPGIDYEKPLDNLKELAEAIR